MNLKSVVNFLESRDTSIPFIIWCFGMAYANNRWPNLPQHLGTDGSWLAATGALALIHIVFYPAAVRAIKALMATGDYRNEKSKSKIR